MLFLVHGLQLLFGYHCEKWAAGGVAEAVRTVLLARPAKTQAAECLAYVCVCVLVAQSCPILCDPMDCSLPGSSVHGISLCVCVCVCVYVTCSVMSDFLQPHAMQLTRLLCPWDFPGKNTEVSHHFLLQGIFPTQGSNPGLSHCRQILYYLSHQRSPVYMPSVFYSFDIILSSIPFVP